MSTNYIINIMDSCTFNILSLFISVLGPMQVIIFKLWCDDDYDVS